MDLQSVKTVYRSTERGFYDGKKIKGRKRHIGVDTQGHLLYAQVGCANRHDGSVVIELFEALAEKYPSIQRFSPDGVHGGMATDYSEILLYRFVDIPKKSEFGFLEPVPHSAPRYALAARQPAILSNREFDLEFSVLLFDPVDVMPLESQRSFYDTL